jgi:hypothetical protein
MASRLFTEAGVHVKQALIGADSSESILSVQRQIASTTKLDLVKPNRVLVCQGKVKLEKSKYACVSTCLVTECGWRTRYQRNHQLPI